MNIKTTALLLATALAGCDAAQTAGGAAGGSQTAAAVSSTEATPAAGQSASATARSAAEPMARSVNDYWRFDNLGNDTLFYTVNAYAVGGQPLAAQTVDWGQGFAAQWRINAKSYSFDYTDPQTQTWLPSHITGTDANVDVYTGASTGANTGKPDLDRRSFWLYKPYVGTRATWVRVFRRVEGAPRAGSNAVDPIVLYGAMGIPTYSDDYIGPGQHKLQIYGTGDLDGYDLWPSTGVIQFQYNTNGFPTQTGRYFLSIQLRGRTPSGTIVDFGRIAGTGRVNGLQRGFQLGSYSYTPAAKTGFRLNGMFFGPHGREVGGTFTAWTPDGHELVGAFAGLSTCQQTVSCYP